MANTLGVGTQKAIPVAFLFSSGMTFPIPLAAAIEAEVMYRAAPRLSWHSFPEGPPSLLGGSGGIDYCYEILHNA